MATIGRDAFYGCSALEKVVLGISVETIGDFAFSECKKLNSINIPSSTKTIGGYAFTHCNELSAIEISSGVMTIGENAFCDCEALKDVVIGEHVVTIGQYAFSSCTSLTDVYIPSSVQVIDMGAFDFCTQLKEITIDYGNLKSIGNAFSGCENLSRIYYGGNSEDWELINIHSDNGFPFTENPYFYSETMPDEDTVENYWYYNSDHEERIWCLEENSFYAQVYAEEFNINYVDQRFVPEQVYDFLSNDFSFINNAIWWESLHLATDPSYALESGMISKQHIYQIALFDVLFASHDTLSPVLMLCDSITIEKMNELINQFYPGEDMETLEYLTEVDEMLESDLFSSYGVDTIGHITTIAEQAENVADAVLYMARYFAVLEMDRNYKIILAEIYLDEDNPLELRLAAKDMVDLMQSSFKDVLKQIAGGNFVEDVVGALANNLWEMLLEMIGISEFQLVGKGMLILGNKLFDMDATLQSYYKLGTAVNIEKALKKMVKDAEPDFFRYENTHLASVYVNRISMYKSALLREYDYCLGLANLSDELRERVIEDRQITIDEFGRIDKAIEIQYNDYYL